MEQHNISRRVSMDTFNRNFYQSDVGKFSPQLQNAIKNNSLSRSWQRNCEAWNYMSKEEWRDGGRRGKNRENNEQLLITNWSQDKWMNFYFLFEIQVRMRNLFPSQPRRTNPIAIVYGFSFLFFWGLVRQWHAPHPICSTYSAHSTPTRDDLCKCARMHGKNMSAIVANVEWKEKP